MDIDETPPGAGLEAPDTFHLLLVPLWPRLPLALAYTGGARWVAFYGFNHNTLENRTQGRSSGRVGSERMAFCVQ